MLKFAAHIKARPGQEALVAEGLRELVEPSRAEDGCLLYDVCRLVEDPTHFVVLEEWTSQEALDAHMATPHFQEFLAKAGSALAEEPELQMMERI